MKRVSHSWLGLIVSISILGSTTACIGRLGRALNGSGTEQGIIPLVGKIMRGIVSGNNYGYGPNGALPGNQYGAYPGQYQGGAYPAYNQQPLGSTYYPNQPVGANGPMQPYYSGQPLQTNLGPQPLVNGAPYQSAPIVSGAPYQSAPTMDVSRQPFGTPIVQTGTVPETSPVVQAGTVPRYR